MPQARDLSRFLQQPTPREQAALKRRDIPGPVELRASSLRWAMTRRGYLASELKDHLIELYQLTKAELAVTSPEGMPVFSNNVATTPVRAAAARIGVTRKPRRR
jgi:hypothetical protein